MKKIDNILEYLKKIGNIIFKYRYYIAIIIFILCVCFEISGSSIGIWNDFIKTNVTDDGVILGTSRGIRSDEWAVLTPMNLSQQADGFNYFSNIIRATSTDVFMVYASPVLNLMEIFRPFQWGYLLLGIAKGLSFFWCARFIVLFLVTLELGMIITKKNKLLSVICAVMVTLAPIVQWWFAVNGIAEIFIFGQLALILLYKYMNTNNFKKRCWYLLLMVICAGGYILVIYPAWQVPMFYVFLALAIWIFIENRKKCKITKRDIISIIVACIVLIGCMAWILTQSIDAITSVMETVYPGSRAEKGGETINRYFEYTLNIFLPFKDVLLSNNVCEKATMFGLFPMGIIISIIAMFKEKKKDLLLIILFIVYAFLSIWCIFGFPEILAKITLMSNSQAKRAILAIGFLDILILIRGLSILKKPINRKSSVIVSIILAVIMVLACKLLNRQYITIKMAVAMVIMCVYLFYFIFRYKAKYANYLFAGGIIFVMIMSGATVNPIRTGVDVIYESEIIKEVQRINQEESGNWITEELDFPCGNYILMAGVPSINCTNTYPTLDRWKLLDEEGKYEKIYNRYAHIRIKLVETEDEYEEKFELKHVDNFSVYVVPNELKELDVKYILTPNELEKFNNDVVNFEKIYSNYGYQIYKLN